MSLARRWCMSHNQSIVKDVFKQSIIFPAFILRFSATRTENSNMLIYNLHALKRKFQFLAKISLKQNKKIKNIILKQICC